MIAPNDISARHQEIQQLIANDRVSEAIKRMMDFVRDFSQDQDDVNDVIVISASYNRLDKSERRGTLSYQNARDEHKQLLYQALELVDNVHEAAGLKTAA